MNKLIPIINITPAGAIRSLILLTAITIPVFIATAIEPREFEATDVQARYQALIEELRCLVCQNQNLADSNAPLAKDLRREIQELLETGRTDAEIKTFMVERYGDFVLYRPPVKPLTLALWFGPGLVLLGALIFLVRAIRHRMTEGSSADANDPERADIDDALQQLKAEEI